MHAHKHSAPPYPTTSPKRLLSKTASPAKRKRPGSSSARAHHRPPPDESEGESDDAQTSKRTKLGPEIERGSRGVLKKLPLEVLNLMFSVDSELNLRDHLALAGSSVFFRNAYRDVVFQVLFQSHHPALSHPPSLIYVGSDGTVVKRDRVAAVRFPEEYGPHARGWREARNIFTSSSEAHRREEEWDLARASDGPGEQPAQKPPRPRGRSLYARRDLASLEVAWPSLWRAKIAELVNTPLIAAKEAKTKFGLSDKQLKTLRRYGNRRRYIKASVSALAETSRPHARPSDAEADPTAGHFA